jgi:hypothetical protein
MPFYWQNSFKVDLAGFIGVWLTPIKVKIF